MEKNFEGKTFLALAIVGLLFVIFFFFLWHIGLFDIKDINNKEKIIVYAIALVGALLSSVVTVIGLILKYSLDQRNIEIKNNTEDRLRLESDRNDRLKTEEENRLNLETVIRIISLLSTSTGDPAPMIQRVALLLALTVVKRFEMAMALTSALIANNELNAFSAASILDRIIEDGDQKDQENAIDIFYQHTNKFVTSDGKVVLPNSLYLWKNNLSDHSREWAYMALARMLLACPFYEWCAEEKKYGAYSILSALSIAWKNEENNIFKEDFGAILKSALIPFCNVGKAHHPGGIIDINQIEKEVQSAKAKSEKIMNLLEDFNVWLEFKSPSDLSATVVWG